jgi:hypothetical protein
MVTLPCVMLAVVSITPLTAKTMVRAPGVSNAAWSEPSPLGASVVTVSTCPPRPPLATAPNPSAPGKLEGGLCMGKRDAQPA